jgi:hypothetical protein
MANVRNDAVEMLARGEAARRAVESRAAWDYRAYFAWGVWLLLAFPPLDFVNGAAWGVVISVTSWVGTMLTVAYFATGTARVHLGRATRMRRWFVFWALWAPWCAAWIVVASVFRDSLSFGYTLAGVAGAAPCLIAGYVSWRAR